MLDISKLYSSKHSFHFEVYENCEDVSIIPREQLCQPFQNTNYAGHLAKTKSFPAEFDLWFTSGSNGITVAEYALLYDTLPKDFYQWNEKVSTGDDLRLIAVKLGIDVSKYVHWLREPGTYELAEASAIYANMFGLVLNSEAIDAPMREMAQTLMKELTRQNNGKEFCIHKTDRDRILRYFYSRLEKEELNKISSILSSNWSSQETPIVNTNKNIYF